ncbi:hypothetical protein J9332_25895 [Aquimarina celericrescens]|nr:hypothetical protein [Aquimarina celericrescens]
MNDKSYRELKLEVQEASKKELIFLCAGSLLWLFITFIWYFTNSPYHKSIYTFMIAGLMLPLAFLGSKIFNTQWKLPSNHLQPLGLWLNFAQLAYFPILIFIFLISPEYFLMVYSIITGAHLFPYAWLYDEIAYAIIAILISVGSLFLKLYLPFEIIWIIALFTSISLLLLFFKIRKG